MPDKKLTDSKVIKGLKCCIERPCDRNCPYIRRIRCNDALMQDALALINRLQAENERLKNDVAISKKETKRYKESYIIAKKESTKNHKELLKSKVFKYVRNPNRIYTIMDFQDGETLRFYDYPGQPNALASGHYKFQGKNDIRLLHISEVKELSYEEIKAEVYKEFAERLHIEFRMYGQKDKFNKAKFLIAVDNLLKELIGE